ncbi:hypothetical protein P153DRAFT_401758 [Dothidotthia symphoricarpi CBS 119687]|uniref:Uncharacterized protein n=1 Tax=Dothidotthia symphoricarpi CBS 119687 TaxID=1392245 RepID=A0A6A5ZY51_9PLEO|nr:uncharacterized protein P153DRAFT_401758 [Dothidotthia symphoricarpi CBS 119687]KAF2123707.1 hypothetical protein P153DRAFT_401758 [Dothidotthia symphoricarpi CBS 119687]
MSDGRVELTVASFHVAVDIFAEHDPSASLRAFERLSDSAIGLSAFPKLIIRNKALLEQFWHVCIWLGVHLHVRKAIDPQSSSSATAIDWFAQQFSLQHNDWGSGLEWKWRSTKHSRFSHSDWFADVPLPENPSKAFCEQLAKIAKHPQTTLQDFKRTFPIFLQDFFDTNRTGLHKRRLHDQGRFRIGSAELKHYYTAHIDLRAAEWATNNLPPAPKQRRVSGAADLEVENVRCSEKALDNLPDDSVLNQPVPEESTSFASPRRFPPHSPHFSPLDFSDEVTVLTQFLPDDMTLRSGFSPATRANSRESRGSVIAPSLSERVARAVAPEMQDLYKAAEQLQSARAARDRARVDADAIKDQFNEQEEVEYKDFDDLQERHQVATSKVSSAQGQSDLLEQAKALRVSTFGEDDFFDNILTLAQGEMAEFTARVHVLETWKNDIAAADDALDAANSAVEQAMAPVKKLKEEIVEELENCKRAVEAVDFSPPSASKRARNV